jgi:hypothetical protein
MIQKEMEALRAMVAGALQNACCVVGKEWVSDDAAPEGDGDAAIQRSAEPGQAVGIADDGPSTA